MKNNPTRSNRLVRILFALCLVSFALGLDLILFSSPVVHANTITVTNTNDSGAGSLRNAISIASPGDTIVFSLTLPATITLSSELDISKTLTISGPGVSLLTISGNNTVRVMSVAPGAALNLSNVTIANGYTDISGGGGILKNGALTVTNTAFANNRAASGNRDGGAINNNSYDTFTISNSNFYNNSANGTGGAIFNLGVMTITNSTFISNTSGYDGVLSNAGIATITNSIFSGNSASEGGGIGNSGTLTITNSTIENNTATNGRGGGLFNGGNPNIRNSGTVAISNSTFSGNSANSAVGPDCAGLGQGGAVINRIGTLTVTNTTFANNSATSFGGGIITVYTSTLSLTNSTLSGNSAPCGGAIFYGGVGYPITVTLSNAIIANSPSGSNCSGAITDGGNNIDDGTSCGFNASSSMTNANPLLGPLANNGGPTKTMSLLQGSPAIDAGNDAICPPTDQRGFGRIGRCDIGTFEYGWIVRFIYLPIIKR